MHKIKISRDPVIRFRITTLRRRVEELKPVVHAPFKHFEFGIKIGDFPINRIIFFPVSLDAAPKRCYGGFGRCGLFVYFLFFSHFILYRKADRRLF